tara:strand:+ start:395 stop:568 length:174 start_codon:yes stop_codon:yes gene_type:complete
MDQMASEPLVAIGVSGGTRTRECPDTMDVGKIVKVYCAIFVGLVLVTAMSHLLGILQ